MVRLFGRNHGRSLFSRGSHDDYTSSDNDNKSSKLRRSPSAALDHHNHLRNVDDDDDDDNDDMNDGGGVTPSSAARSSYRHSSISTQLPQQPILLSSPMYEYAINEYALAVAPGTSNDDGKSVTSTNHTTLMSTTKNNHLSSPGVILPAPSNIRVRNSSNHPSYPYVTMPMEGYVDACENDVETGTGTTAKWRQAVEYHHPQYYHTEVPPSPPPTTTTTHSQIHQQQHPPTQAPYYSHVMDTATTTNSSSVSVSESTSHTNARRTSNIVASIDDLHHNSNNPTHYRNSKMLQQHDDTSSDNIRSAFEQDMPDATYEEVYGPAYIGGAIKYIYPMGYQSMRPRSCPWKLSIIICLLFTWLSIFIVGHCSDQADESAALAAAGMANYDANGVITDDALVIEIRWCGSRLLYMMWATSMMVTGISAAYCSVIGYIKVRDFAVANSRSQPPGVAEGKSDYYVRIRDHVLQDDTFITGSNNSMIRRNSYRTDGGSSSISYYQPTIYQSDGTPQFWGSHIYRPTQAAVAVTSR